MVFRTVLRKVFGPQVVPVNSTMKKIT